MSMGRSRITSRVLGGHRSSGPLLCICNRVTVRRVTLRHLPCTRVQPTCSLRHPTNTGLYHNHHPTAVAPPCIRTPPCHLPMTALLRFRHTSLWPTTAIRFLSRDTNHTRLGPVLSPLRLFIHG